MIPLQGSICKFVLHHPIVRWSTKILPECDDIQKMFKLLNKYTKSKLVNNDKNKKISSNKKSQFDKDSNINIIESMKRKL